MLRLLNSLSLTAKLAMLIVGISITIIDESGTPIGAITIGVNMDAL